VCALELKNIKEKGISFSLLYYQSTFDDLSLLLEER